MKAKIHFHFQGEPNESGKTVFLRMENDNGTWFDAPDIWTSSFICLKDPDMVGLARIKGINI